MMNDIELVREGFSLMFVGMGFVIIFLLLLIAAISVISNIINRFFPEPMPAPVAPTLPSSPHTDEMAELRPVIMAAIAHHRRQQGLH